MDRFLRTSVFTKRSCKRLGIFWFLAGFALLCFPGCSLWGKSELKQYRDENDRLLGEFRLQRDRAEQLEVEKRALVSRVRDLETRMAAISSALADPANSSAAPFMPASQAQGGAPDQFSLPAQPPTQAPALDMWQSK